MRHDAVLRLLCNWLRGALQRSDVSLHVDLHGNDFKALDQVFTRLRPDVAIVDDHNIRLLELTICHEINQVKSKNYPR